MASANPVALAEARQNLNAVALAFPGTNLPRFEISVAAIHKDRLAIPGIEHRIRGYGECRGYIHAELDVGVHIRF